MVLNIFLDLYFVCSLGLGIAGAAFCVIISTVVCITAPWFYVGIGILFMLYGYYRAVNCPVVSVILIIISLGTRVLLANVLSGIETVGVTGIWVSIPIGWILADLVGIIYYFMKKQKRH